MREGGGLGGWKVYIFLVPLRSPPALCTVAAHALSSLPQLFVMLYAGSGDGRFSSIDRSIAGMCVGSIVDIL